MWHWLIWLITKHLLLRAKQKGTRVAHFLYPQKTIKIVNVFLLSYLMEKVIMTNVLVLFNLSPQIRYEQFKWSTIKLLRSPILLYSKKISVKKFLFMIFLTFCGVLLTNFGILLCIFAFILNHWNYFLNLPSHICSNLCKFAKLFWVQKVL